MRDPKRIPRMLRLLSKIWTANPDLRLVQLLLNLENFGEHSPSPPYYWEDDYTERNLEKVYEDSNSG